MKNKKTTDEKDDISFNGSFDEEKTEDVHDIAVKKLDEMRKLDENNPLERAEKYDMVKKHPVRPGYMAVKCYEVRDKDGEPFVVSVSKQDDGSFKTVEIQPFMVVDPYMLYAGNIAQCPMNVVPMLIDQAEQQVELRKDTFIKRKEKRGEFNWWWIVFIFLIIMGVIPIALVMFTKFIGGG